jgi:F-type H+-transporting ATPase subunit b
MQVQMNQIKKILICFLIATLNVSALYAAEGHGSSHANAHEGVPMVVLYQAINVGLIVVGLFYFLRHKAGAFFAAKREEYIAAQDRAKSALTQAEHEHHDVHTKLIKLETTKQETLMRAKADAVELRRQLMIDAELIIKRVKEEAALAAKLEIERAKAELRNQLMNDAIAVATKEISNKSTNEDQLRLQQNFINKVQVVQ